MNDFTKKITTRARMEILARVVHHPGENFHSRPGDGKIVISPGRERKFLPSKLLLKIVRIQVLMVKNSRFLSPIVVVI